jgi:DNA-binding SARP family transcriptional activator
MTVLRLDLLGGLVIRPAAGAVAPLASRKAAALLGVLALQPGRPQPRERLAGLLWDRAAETQARASLRQALAALRRSVPGLVTVLDIGGDAVALRGDGTGPGAISTDVAEFEAAAAARTPASLARAAELYRGDLLDGLRPGSAAFEAWLMPERERLRARAVAAMRALLDQAQDRGDAAEAQVALALRLLTLEPSLEEVHRALMRLHARLGRHGDALRQYDACRAALRRDLDVAPDAETERLYRTIRECRRTAAAATALPRPAATPAGGPAIRPHPLLPDGRMRLRLVETGTDCAHDQPGREHAHPGPVGAVLGETGPDAAHQVLRDLLGALLGVAAGDGAAAGALQRAVAIGRLAVTHSDDHVGSHPEPVVAAGSVVLRGAEARLPRPMRSPRAR